MKISGWINIGGYIEETGGPRKPYRRRKLATAGVVTLTEEKNTGVEFNPYVNGKILCQGDKNLRNNLFYFDIRQLIDEGISYESQIKPKLYPEAIIKIVKVIKTLRICKIMQ